VFGNSSRYMTQGNLHISRIARYFDLMGWVAQDSIWRLRRISALGLSASFGALVAQIGALAVVALYAHLLERGGEVTLLGQTLEPRGSAVMLVGAGTAALVLLLLSSVLMYVSGRASVRLRREYQEFCTQRALDALSARYPILVPHDQKGRSSGQVVRIVRGDSGYSGWVAQLGLEAIIPALSAVCGIAVLLVMEPLLTLMVTAFIVFSLVVLMRVSVRAARASVRMEKTSPLAAAAVRECVVALRHGHSERPDGVLDGPFREHLDARDVRMSALHGSRLVSNVFLSAALFIVIVALGTSILHDGTGWSRLLVYLAICRYSLYSLRSVTQLLTSINRFYPQLSRYRMFVDMSRLQEGDRLPDVLSIQLGSRAVAGSRQSLSLGTPGRIAVVTALELNRFTVGTIVWSLCGQDCFLANSILRDVRLAEGSFMPASKQSVEEVRRADRVIFIPAATFTEPCDGVDSDTTVLVTSSVSRARLFEPDTVVVLDRSEVCGIGDVAWMEENRAEIQRIVDSIHADVPVSEDDGCIEEGEHG